jgi:ABC-2 type transport system permease protein
MSTTIHRRPGLTDTLRSERIKLTTVRSTWWTLAALVVIGIGGTVLLCALNAEWLASPEANEAPGSFITGGIGFAQICAVVLGVLAVSGEYGSGMIRSTISATPFRGRVLAAKMIVLATVLFVVGALTALAGYFAGNYFLDREGVGLALEGDMARSIYGSGLFLAASGLFAAAAGFILRHTAATLAVVLGLMFVVSNLVVLVPGKAGEVLVDVMPANAGSVISTPVPFNPELMDAWPGFGVFVGEVAALMLLAWYLLRRRDA